MSSTVFHATLMSKKSGLQYSGSSRSQRQSRCPGFCFSCSAASFKNNKTGLLCFDDLVMKWRIGGVLLEHFLDDTLRVVTDPDLLLRPSGVCIAVAESWLDRLHLGPACSQGTSLSGRDLHRRGDPLSRPIGDRFTIRFGEDQVRLSVLSDDFRLRGFSDLNP